MTGERRVDPMATDPVQDPVCGMLFSPEQAACTHEWGGRRLHFCCESCLQAFLADPRRFLQRDGKVAR